MASGNIDAKRSSFLLIISAGSLIMILATFFMRNFDIGSRAGENAKNNAGEDQFYKSGSAVDDKWNLSGSFVAHPGYNWAGLAEGATWKYNISIKEALAGESSTGSVNFWTDDIHVLGQVKETKEDYNWATVAAFGTADYNDHLYNFMLFYDEIAVWFALSDQDYTDFFAAEGTFTSRAYELHSKVPDETFEIYFRDIR